MSEYDRGYKEGYAEAEKEMEADAENSYDHGYEEGVQDERFRAESEIEDAYDEGYKEAEYDVARTYRHEIKLLKELFPRGGIIDYRISDDKILVQTTETNYTVKAEEE